MRRAVFMLVISLVVVSCATMEQRSEDLVSRAVHAMGGTYTLAGIRTLSVKATVRQWEPEQSMVAGGEMRFACEATFEAVTDVGSGATRINWVRKFAYPEPRTFTFSEIVSPEAGYVAGIDSNGRTKQSLESKPPAHAMSGPRLAATQRELRPGSSLLLLEMLRNPERVSYAREIAVGGGAYPAVDYRAGDQTFTVMFDRGTGLPARIRTLDYDNVWGDVTYDLVLADWQTIDDVRVATTRTYELNGRPIAEIKITGGKINAPSRPERPPFPASSKRGRPRPRTGPVPYQWVIRRQFIGTHPDSAGASYATRATSGRRLSGRARGA